MGTFHTAQPHENAIARLTDTQRAQLESLRASYAMEQVPISDATAELAARYLLGELTFGDLRAELGRRRG